MGEGFSGNRLDRLYAPPEIGAPGRRRTQAQRRDLLLAGGFVLSMALVVVAALMLLMPGMLGRAYRLSADFPSAEGLDAGMEVVQAGYVIGFVEQVRPLFPGQGGEVGDACRVETPSAQPCFRATLRIRRDWPIPVDSFAQIDSEGLLKGDAVEINPGSSDKRLLSGDAISVRERDPSLAARAGELTETLRSLVRDSIAPAVESIQVQIGAIESLVGSGDEQGQNRERLAGAFENLQDLTGRLSEAVDPTAVAGILSSVRTMSDNLATMTSELRSSTGDIRQAVTNYGDLAQDVRGLVSENRPALQKSIDDTQYLLQELSAALTPILTNVEDATRDLSALARELRNDPKTLLQDREAEERAPWFQ